jgi:type II secretory pathway pseudopilin PulG
MRARITAPSGYAMVALLVGLSVMSVAATLALPVWKQAAQREKEAELIFRGEQYKRAVALFQRRAGPGVLPPDIDFLVENRFLRRAYRDPMTSGDFEVIRRGGVSGPARAGEPPGVVGVVSRSQERSIRLYGDRDVYNEWLFVHQEPSSGPGPTGTTPSPTPPRGAGETGGPGGRSDVRE